MKWDAKHTAYTAAWMGAVAAMGLYMAATQTGFSPWHIPVAAFFFAAVALGYVTKSLAGPGDPPAPSAPQPKATPFRTASPPPVDPPPTPRNDARARLDRLGVELTCYATGVVLGVSACAIMAWASGCTPAARKPVESVVSKAETAGALCLAALHVAGTKSNAAQDAAFVCNVEQLAAELTLMALEEADSLQASQAAAGGVVDVITGDAGHD